MGLNNRTDEELPFAVQEAQEQFPLLVNPIDIDIVLCVSHAMRTIINRRQNEAKAMMHESRGGTTAYVEWCGEDINGTTCQPRGMIVGRV